MSYCTLDDLITQFGRTELLRLTDSGKTGRVNADEVQLAIVHIDGVIDRHISKVERVPLASVPAELQGYACDLVRARLYRETITDEVKRREDIAMAYLRAIRDGELPLFPNEPSAASYRLVRRLGKSRTDWDTF